MANMSWLGVIVICIAPALILFIAAGAISIYRRANSTHVRTSKEVDHEL